MEYEISVTTETNFLSFTPHYHRGLINIKKRKQITFFVGIFTDVNVVRSKTTTC